METTHLRNTLAMLNRRAAALHMGYELHLCRLPEPLGEVAQDAFDREIMAHSTTDPKVWMSRQPIYRALREELDRRLQAEQIVEALRSKGKVIAHVFRLTKQVAYLDLEVDELEHDIMGTGSHGYPTTHLARRLAQVDGRLRKVKRDWRKAVQHLRHHPLALRMLLPLAVKATRSAHTCYKCRKPMAVTMDGAMTVWPHGRPGITVTGLPQYGCDECKVYFGPTWLWNFVLEAVFGTCPNKACYGTRCLSKPCGKGHRAALLGTSHVTRERGGGS